MADTKISKEGFKPKRPLPKKEIEEPVIEPEVIANQKVTPADIPIFDLKQLNMVQTVQELSELMNKPRPKMLLFKWWQAKHIPYDRQRINWLFEYLKQVREINQETVNLQAELFISQAVVEDLIQGYQDKARMLKELQFKEHEFALHALENQMEQKELANEKLRAEIDNMKTMNALTNMQVKLLDKVITEFDLNHITPEQAFVLVKAMNPQASADVDFYSQRMLVEQQLERMKAETAKIIEQAKQEGSQAKLAEATADDTIKRLRKVE